MKKCEIRESGIPGAGKGLFAIVPIKKDEIITGYGGSFFINVKSKYLLRDSLGVTWDAEEDYDDELELGRFANDADFNPENFGHRYQNNCEFYSSPILGIPPKLKATRDIEAGEEIFVPYGENYWSFWGKK